MQTKVNFIWLLLVTGFLAGCQTPEPHQACETVSAGMHVGHDHDDHVEVSVVSAIEPATTSTKVTLGHLEIRVSANGTHQMSHEFELYDGKVLYGGELISINDYLWEILPEEQR